jgi:hypothetical protein
MGNPIRSTQVKFDIARELRAVAQPYPGATKIRAAEQIPFSGVPDVQPASIGCRGQRAVKITTQPNFLQKFFCK